MKRIPVIMCVLIAAACCGPAFAQSDAELRLENERLRVENSDLRRALESANRRLADLEREVGRLRRELAAVAAEPLRPDEDDEPREPGSVDEGDPASSPRALLAALAANYDEALGDKEIGAPRSREREQYLRALQQWRQRVQRDYRNVLIEWHVRVIEAAPTTGGYTMRLLVIDPRNLAELGSPFNVHVPRGAARRYEQLAARDEVGLLVLRGSMAPAININESRTAPGPFNNPPFIGPFAEFRFNLDVRTLTPADEEDR